MMNIEEIRHLYQDTINGKEGIRVSVAVALVNRKDEILLERRKDSGWWGITGGKLEAGETITECGIRELQEETGYLIKEPKLKFVGIYSNPRDGRIINYDDNRVHLIDIVYYYITNKLTFEISNESYELKFFKKYYLPDNIVPPALEPIKDICSFI